MMVSEREAAAQGRSPIQAVDRAVALLEALAAAGPAGATLTTATTSAGLHASTGRTLLASLVHHGLVAQIEATRRYVLGPRLFELQRTYSLQRDLGSVAAPVLRDLWSATDETVHLATLQHGRRVDVMVLVSPQMLNINPSGMPSAADVLDPLVHTAAGKVLLAGAGPDERDRMLAGLDDETRRGVEAQLDAVRAAGHATNREEEVQGVCGVAASVRDHTGAVVAALCIGYPSARQSRAREDELVAAAVAAADELSTRLGASDA